MQANKVNRVPERYTAASQRLTAEFPPAVSVSAMAEVGALVGDPARMNMLVALLNEESMTARQLADRAGVTPQTASGHIAKLVAAGLLSMERSGRRHIHRLGSDNVVELLHALHVSGSLARDNFSGVAPTADGELAVVRSLRS